MIGGVSSTSLFATTAGATGSAASTARARSAGLQNANDSASETAQSPQVQQQIQSLRRTDQAVRAHEQAHMAAGGAIAGGASFQFVKGPDGKDYAVAGEVPIDISPEREPEATIRKMETVKRAALAPADPSAQDVRVAAQADAQAAKARGELAKQSASDLSGGGGGGNGDGKPSPSDGRDGSASPARAARGTAAYGAAAALGAAAFEAATARRLSVTA